MRALELRDKANELLLISNNAKQQLQEIKNIETGVDYLNKVKAIQVWAKAEKKDSELQNIIAEQKLRTQRLLGGLLIDSNISKTKHQNLNNYSKSHNITSRLSDFGITRNESSAFQKISSLPEETFEREIETAKEQTNRRIELTTSRMLKVAKEYELLQKKKNWETKTEQKSFNNKFIDIYNTEKKFRIIYADPAWSYNDKQNTSMLGGAEKHYGTMNIEDIKNLPIEKISEKNSVLFLWATSPLLPEALDVISSWGYKYKTSFVWDKVKHNMGHYNSVRHEFMLLATIGSCTPDKNILFDSVQTIERNNNHSEKPIEFMNIIDELYSYGNKIELFSRQIKKDNWFGWGNEL